METLILSAILASSAAFVGFKGYRKLKKVHQVSKDANAKPCGDCCGCGVRSACVSQEARAKVDF